MENEIQNGLTQHIFDIVNFNSIKLGNECSCEIKIKEKCLDKNKFFDEGLLIALVDTFSSYAIMFLISNENYINYLSANIKMTSYDDISSSTQNIKILVKLLKQWERNALLEILIYSNDKEIKRFTHLKRKISSKL